MSLRLEYYSVIIPIENLKRILNDSELQKILVERNKHGALFDDYLYRESSMNPIDNESIVNFWEEKGLVPFGKKDGEKFCKDLCIIAFPDDTPTIPCEWIEIFREPENSFSLYVNLKGRPKDNLINERRDIKEIFKIKYSE